MMLHSCALLGIDTVTANAVPSAVVLVGKFIDYDYPPLIIPSVRSMMSTQPHLYWDDLMHP